MSYFDKNKESYVLVDASPVRAIWSQKTTGQEDQTVIAFASSALTDVETKYSQTKRKHWLSYGQWNNFISIYMDIQCNF